MRNIKTTLRFARNTALLFAAASGMAYLTGCQSEQGLNPDNNEVPEAALSTASYTVYGSNPNRVRNYDGATTRGGAAGVNTLAATFPMPESVSIPTDAKDLLEKDQWGNTPNLNYGTPAAGGVYYIKAGDSLNNGIDFKGITLYVAGELTLPYINASNENTIYVLTGGKLNLSTPINPGITIYNYGTIAGTFEVSANAKVYSAVDITVDGDFSVTVKGDDKGELFCRGTIWAKNVMLNGDAVACAFIADNRIEINGQGTIQTTYLEAPYIDMRAGNVVLEDNGLVWAKTELFPENTSSKLTTVGSKALVYAKNVKTNDSTTGSHVPEIFCDAKVWVIYETVSLSNEVMGSLKDKTASHIYHISQVSEGKDAYNETIKVSGDGTCHKSFGFTGNPDKPYGEIDDPKTPTNPTEPDEEEEPEVKLIPVADIENPDVEDPFKHDHGDISATCISFGGNGVAYASFHRRGTENSDYNQGYVDNKGHKGCIEKIVYQNGEFALTSFMIAPEWDFNHILADGNRIIAVGNHVDKGAFIGWLPQNFDASEGVSDEFKYKELTTAEPLYGTSDKTGETIKLGYKNAGDGNCVIRHGEYYYVTTYEGYGPLKASDFSRVKNSAGDVVFTPTTGSAKHIAHDDNGNMAIINLDRKGKGVTESSATIQEFAVDDYTFGSVKNSYPAGANVAPIDGKNTIAYNGSDIFACLGKGGLVKNGNWFYQRSNAPVNGVTVVGDYIFVANGSFLDVLDLQGNRLCHYHDKNLHSSNFVAVDNNGFIYVAFGKSDIKIFKLGGTKVADNWYIAGK